MMPSKNGLHSKLASLLGYDHVVLFGRARAALVAVIEETVSASAPVIIPSNACSALLAAVIASGRTPILASVSAETGLVPDAELATLIAGWTSEPGLVLITHLYGMVASYPETIAAAEIHGWQLFENDSLASGAFFRAEKRPGRGVIVSFGHGKALDGGGGGALLTDDAHLAANLSDRIAAWPVPDLATDAVEDHVVLARRHLAALGVSSAAEMLLPIEAAQCRHAFDYRWREKLEGAIVAFPTRNDRKLQRLATWRCALRPVAPAMSTPAVPVGAAWRAIFRVSEGALRDRIVTALRGAGFDVGTNYPPLWDSAPKLAGRQRAPGGDGWGARVLTLWLTEAYDDARIRVGAEIIARTIEERAS